MSFAGEMKDFRDAYEQGTRIALNRANTQKVQMNMPLQPGSDPGGQGSFVPGAGAGIGTANAPQASGGAGGGYSPTKEDIAAWTDYIGEGAAKRGMDPAIAIKVAQSEGLAPGVWQSRLPAPGGGKGQEASFGPFQMYTGGGLGNSFQRDTGLDPSDPKNVLKTIDYALDHAKQNGWGAWHGWKGDPWAGINRSGRSDASPYTYTPTSGTPVAAAGVDQTKTAGIPDDEEQAAEAPAEEDAVTAENPEITVLPVQKASLVNPRVVMEEDQVGGLYARGGAIPDDSTNFAGGGLNDVAGLYSGVQNTNAQATPIRTGSTGTNSGVNQPRRITFAQPDQTWRTWGGGTPSQTKFRTPAVTPAAQTAQPAAAAAPSNAVTYNPNPTGLQTKIAQVKNQVYGSPWESSDHQTGHQKSQLNTLNRLKAINKQRNSGTNHAEGGMVSYAEGGPVPDFNEWKRRETRMSGRAEEAGQGARDQAARRMNMRERGIDSTAYKDPSTKFPPRPSPFKTPPPNRSGGGRPQTSGGGPQPGPAPDWAFAPAYEPGDTGPRPPATADTSQRTQPLLGTPATPDSMRPDHFSVGGTENAPAEPEAPKPTVPDAWLPDYVPTVTDDRTYPEGDPRAPQTSSSAPAPYMYHARGGAIPDDDSSSPMRSARAESSNLGPKKAKARARTDPWEGLRTKESKPVRKPTKKGGREAAKRAKPKSQRPDDAGAPVPTPRPNTASNVPTPTPRPDPTTGQNPPIPTPRPSTGGPPTPTPRPGQPAPYTGDWSGPSDVRVAGGKGPRLQPRPGPEIGATSPSQLPRGRVEDYTTRQGIPGQVTPSGRTAAVPGHVSPGPPNVNVAGGKRDRLQPGGTQPRIVGPPLNYNPPGQLQATQPPQTDFLKLGRSTIADFLDMLSPEDLSRPIEDLANLNVQGGGGPPAMRRGGAIPDDGR